jgi:CubicO group peptidase (beta-lactamase class C family)
VSVSFALLDREGKVIESHGPALPIYSISTTFIAYLAMDLKIDIQRSVSGWICSGECIHNQGIRVIHLLNHTSGLRDYGQISQYQEEVEQGKDPWQIASTWR